MNAILLVLLFQIQIECEPPIGSVGWLARQPSIPANHVMWIQQGGRTEIYIWINGVLQVPEQPAPPKKKKKAK